MLLDKIAVSDIAPANTGVIWIKPVGDNYEQNIFLNGKWVKLDKEEEISGIVSSVNNQTPDSNGNVNLTKEHIGLEKVDNTSDTEKVVKGASEDGNGNDIATTYETKSDATSKQTAINTTISELQVQVAQLSGVENAFFGGIVGASTDIATDYTNNGYSGTYLYMVGTDMSSLVAYQYTGNGSPTQLFGGTTYDFTDYTEVKQKVAALGPKINNIASIVGGVEVETETDLASDGTWTDGKLVFAAGSSEGATSSSSTMSFVKIDVSQYIGKKLYYSRKIVTSASNSGLAFYSGTSAVRTDVIAGAGETFKVGESAGFELSSIDIPQTAKIVVVTFATADKNDFRAYVLTTTTSEGLQGAVTALQAGQTSISNEVANVKGSLSETKNLSFVTSNADNWIGYNKMRRLADTSMIFEDGDILKSVTIKSTGTAATDESLLRIYNSSKELVGEAITLGLVGTEDTTFDLSSQNIILHAGDYVALTGIPYNNTSTSKYYDFRDDSTPNLDYGFSVAITRNLDKFNLLNEKIKAAAKNKKTLKVLCFGSSFTQDSVSYVPWILKGLYPNIELTIGLAYYGGCVLGQHCANITNTSQTVGSNTYSPINYTSYHKYTDGADKWTTSSNVSASFMIEDEDWDIITCQQGSSQSTLDYSEYYEPFIHKIERALFAKVSKPVRLEWISIPGCGSTSSNRSNNYISTTANTQRLMRESAFELLSPYGTAIQNLRTIASINSLGGDGSQGGGLTYDNYHLEEGLGCLAASYVNTIVWLRAAGVENISIVGESTRPDSAWVLGHSVPIPHWYNQTVIGISEDNVYLAQLAAILAVKNPYNVTDMSEFVFA